MNRKAWQSCLLSIFSFAASAQIADSIPDTQIEPPEPLVVANSTITKSTTNNFEKIKVDGIAAVVGDYVILNSDIEKTLIDLRSQGASHGGYHPLQPAGETNGRQALRPSGSAGQYSRFG